MNAKVEKFDSLTFIMDYEFGEIDDERMIAGFQNMIDTGLVWQLQGSYGRTAAALIEAGYCRDIQSDAPVLELKSASVLRTHGRSKRAPENKGD